MQVWILCCLCHMNNTPYYRFCQVRQPVDEDEIWVAQGMLDPSKHLTKMQRPQFRRQLNDQETSYILCRRHPSKLAHNPAGRLQPQHDACTEEIWHTAWPETGRADCCHQKDTLFVHGCVQLTGHITAGWTRWWKIIFQSALKSADKTLMILTIEEILRELKISYI